MNFRFLGIRFEISVPFAVITAFLLIMDKTGFMSASLFAVLAHEAGHFIAMRAVGCAPHAVNFCASGVLIAGASFCTASENVIIALSGPAANLLFCGLFYLTGKLSGLSVFLICAAVQLLLGLVNLLPIQGLDGGTVLFQAFSAFQKRNALLAAQIISILTASALTVAGVAVAVRNTGNPSLLLLGVYLIILNIMKS